MLGHRRRFRTLALVVSYWLLGFWVERGWTGCQCAITGPSVLVPSTSQPLVQQAGTRKLLQDFVEVLAALTATATACTAC